jgi:hypothetical protein
MRATPFISPAGPPRAGSNYLTDTSLIPSALTVVDSTANIPIAGARFVYATVYSAGSTTSSNTRWLVELTVGDLSYLDAAGGRQAMSGGFTLADAGDRTTPTTLPSIPAAVYLMYFTEPAPRRPDCFPRLFDPDRAGRRSKPCRYRHAAGRLHYTAGAVGWTDADGDPATTFEDGGVYTASVNLTAAANYLFSPKRRRRHQRGFLRLPFRRLGKHRRFEKLRAGQYDRYPFFRL